MAASGKLDLLRMSLESRLNDLSPDVNSNKIEALRQELNSSSPSSFSQSHNNTLTRAHQYSALAKPAALSGKLHVRLASYFPFDLSALIITQ